MADQNTDISQYQESQKVSSPCILGLDLMSNTAQNPEIAENEAEDEMREHFLLMMAREYFIASEPIEEAERERTRLQAEAFLVADGYKLITEGKIAGLF